MDGTGLRFETFDHGGEYPDTMPQAIKLTDAEGRSPSMCRSRKTARWSTAKGTCSFLLMNDEQSPARHRSAPLPPENKND
jgi:hypothetical protein